MRSWLGSEIETGVDVTRAPGEVVESEEKTRQIRVWKRLGREVKEESRW